jgi:Kef-type K+ transport system membrane component KefB
MDPLMQFLLLLAIIIVAAKGAGYISTRLGQPSVLGGLVVGLILGPTGLDLLHLPVFQGASLGETVEQLAHLGVLLLMFAAGLEVDFEAMMRAGKPALLAGILGVVSPVLLGMLVVMPFGYAVDAALAIGLVLAATSVSISAQTLMELGVLRSRVGMALLGAAVVDDVLVILLFSVFGALAVGEGSGLLTVLWVLARMVAVLAVTAWLGTRLLPRVLRVVDRLPISEGVTAFTLVAILLLAWFAEYLGGMAAITGAFLAGLFFARTNLRHYIEERMHVLAYSWLVPIFFVSIGLEANARAVGLSGLPFALAVVGVAFLSKVLGSGLGARLAGFSNGDALRLGVGMISRGEVGLILVAVAQDDGLIDDAVFATVVLMVLVTSLVTPLLLRLLYPQVAIKDPVTDLPVEAQEAQEAPAVKESPVTERNDHAESVGPRAR